MGEKSVTISRKELYEQVWNVPMRTLAKQYGLSDVGLAKICKKHDIPRPSLGYWRKKEVGKEPKQTPLPPKNSNENIEIYSNPIHDSNSEEMETALKEFASKTSDERIIVSEDLRKPHPLIKQSAEILNSIQPDATGLIFPRQDKCLDIKVSKKSLRRALLIMDALIKALEARNFEVLLTGKSTEVKLLETTLEISISEQLIRVRKEPKDPDFEGSYRFGHSRFEEQSVPSGNLSLLISNTGFYLRGHFQQNWRDAKTQRLEGCLDSFVTGLVKAAIGKKESIEKRRQEEQESLKREREWAENRRRAEEEKHKFEKLMRDVEEWQKSKRIREYIAAVAEMAATGKYTFNFEGGLDNWLKWARAQADRTDPLFPAPKPPKEPQEKPDGGGDPPKCDF
jgi:hypothetical protein